MGLSGISHLRNCICSILTQLQKTRGFSVKCPRDSGRGLPVWASSSGSSVGAENSAFGPSAPLWVGTQQGGLCCPAHITQLSGRLRPARRPRPRLPLSPSPLPHRSFPPAPSCRTQAPEPLPSPPEVFRPAGGLTSPAGGAFSAAFGTDGPSVPPANTTFCPLGCGREPDAGVHTGQEGPPAHSPSLLFPARRPVCAVSRVTGYRVKGQAVPSLLPGPSQPGTPPGPDHLPQQTNVLTSTSRTSLGAGFPSHR